MKPTDAALLGTAGVVGSGLVAWRRIFPWIGHDIKTIRRLRIMSSEIQADLLKKRYLLDMFEEAVERTPEKPFIIFEGREYTYGLMEQQVNRVANIAIHWNLNIGETVAIMMTNEPAFIWTFLGLQKLGLAVSFINYHLRRASLAHTIAACEAKVLILGEEESTLHSVMEIKAELGELPVYVSGRRGTCPEGYLDWSSAMADSLPVPVSKRLRDGVQADTHCCYIFTSGTTGLPKPCIITQGRCLGFAKSYRRCGMTSDDVVYTATPLYHSAAGGLVLMGVLNTGATMVLKRKFSARQYWNDVRRYDVTVLQYIGELCRYMLAVPKSPLDGVHKVRCAIGNGLREDIWREFQERFKVPQIYEFFGATEGTQSTLNVSNKVGACGRASPILNMVQPLPVYIVKCDLESGEIYRDKNGHCVQIKPGETGMILSGLGESYATFKFYKASEQENLKKVVENVFRPGDAYFCFGDLIYLDEDYFIYFRDRIGDTFRWKAENVSTYEVSNALNSLEFVHDANIYGVRVAGRDGRAGMAAISLNQGRQLREEDLAAIYSHCEATLPSYARPVFLRFPGVVEETTTFKQRKVELVKQGYDPGMVTDPLYYKDDGNKTYSPLSLTVYSQLLTKAKL